MLIHSQDEFEKEVLDYQGKVIVDFFATWCGPCMMQSPIVEEFEETHPEIKCVQVDTDECPGIAREFSVVSIPTLVAMENGEIVKKSIGLTQDLEELFE